MYYDEARANLGKTIRYGGLAFRMVAIITDATYNPLTRKLEHHFCNPIVVPVPVEHSPEVA